MAKPGVQDRDTGFEVGQQVRMVGKFEDFAGDPANPTTVVAKLIDPAGTQTGPSVTPGIQAEDGSTPEVGTAFADHTIALAGIHQFRFEGTGAIVAAQKGEFFVDENPFT